MITAHPTEVRRKTVLEVLDELSDLLEELDLRRDDPAAVTRVEHELSVCVLVLWQTALLRLSKLRVQDEINEAIRYYDTSLFDVIPALTRDLAAGVAAVADGKRVDTSRAITMGSWIGGDRDGNPFVTADVVRYATGRQTETALAHHLAALYRLSRRLSMTDRLVAPSSEVTTLAAASGDDSPFRADEPYRRALPRDARAPVCVCPPGARAGRRRARSGADRRQHAVCGSLRTGGRPRSRHRLTARSRRGADR